VGLEARMLPTYFNVHDRKSRNSELIEGEVKC
jgi:hypothetical protein